MALHFRPNFDGSGNDLTDPLENAAGQPLARLTSAHFADGISVMRPEDVNPREVSNIVFGAGNPEVESKASSLWAVMGQFVDHDLDLVRSGGADISIQVPAGDARFPDGTILPVTRAQIDPTTGAGTGHPAAAVNSLSAWLDLSQTYGSDQATNDSLRTHEGGHLLTSPGDNLPLVNGRFAAGDIRVGENDYLSSIQTLFLREHNHQADRLSAEHPTWSDEQIFQTARAWTTAEYQNILEKEFLPVLLGKDSPHFTGYKASIDASLNHEFAGAVFRYGHSVIESSIDHLSNSGVTLDSKSLATDFLDSPSAALDFGGMDALLRAQASENANKLDSKIIPELRNFLVDGGPATGSDLGAINLKRGDDLGLPHYNEARIELGLKPFTSFSQFDKEASAALKEAYHGDIGAVDLFTGILAERDVHGGQLGQVGSKVIGTTFSNLINGDRFWFENSSVGFTKSELKELHNTSMSDLILRNTDTTDIQKSAFLALDREDFGLHKNKHLIQHEANPPEKAGTGLTADTKVAAAPDPAAVDLTKTDAAAMLKLVVDNAHQETAQPPVQTAQAQPLVTVDSATDTFHFNTPDKAAPGPAQPLLVADAAAHALDVHTAPEAAHALPEAMPVLDPLQMLAQHQHDHGVFA